MAVFAGIKNGVLYVDPGAVGNSTIQYSVNDVPIFIRGVDTAAANSFKMALGNTLGVADRYVMDVNGAQTLPTNSAFLNLENVENNVTGDGTIHYLGSVVAMTNVVNRNTNMTVGSPGVAATFTAPVTGLYLISYVGSLTCPIVPPVIPSTCPEYVIVTTARNYIIGRSGRNYVGYLEATDLAGSVCAAMTAGDTAVFSVQAVGLAVLADSTALGYCSGTLMA